MKKIIARSNVMLFISQVVICTIMVCVIQDVREYADNLKPEVVVVREEVESVTKDTLIQKFKLPVRQAVRLGAIIDHASVEQTVPKELIISVMMVESSFKSNSRSHKGAVGYMQVIPKWWGECIHEVGYDVYDRADNIYVGACVLNSYYQSLGSWEAAVQAYNVGLTAYNRGVRAEGYLNKVNKQLAKMGVNVGGLVYERS